MKYLLENLNLRLFWLCWLALALNLPATARKRTVVASPLASPRCDYHLRWDGCSTRLWVQTTRPLAPIAPGSDSPVLAQSSTGVALYPLLKRVPPATCTKGPVAFEPRRLAQ